MSTPEPSVAVRESLMDGGNDAKCAARLAQEIATNLKRHLSESANRYGGVQRSSCAGIGWRGTGASAA